MQATLTGAPTGVGQVAITVRDTAEAVAFYRDRVGLRLLFEAPPGLAFFECGGLRLMLSPPEGEVRVASSILYFEVEDIRASHAAMMERGVVFRDEPHKVAELGAVELWMAFFDDGQGNVMALMAEV